MTGRGRQVTGIDVGGNVEKIKLEEKFWERKGKENVTGGEDDKEE